MDLGASVTTRMAQRQWWALVPTELFRATEGAPPVRRGVRTLFGFLPLSHSAPPVRRPSAAAAGLGCRYGTFDFARQELRLACKGRTAMLITTLCLDPRHPEGLGSSSGATAAAMASQPDAIFLRGKIDKA